MLRVCIADDHLLILTGIRQALQAAEDIEVAGFTQSGDEVLALVAALSPDVMLLDNRMPGTDGMTCIRLIRDRHPETRIVMLSASEDPKHIDEALTAGASAYIGKRINPVDLASALRQVVSGVVYYRSAPAGVEDPAPADAASDLTVRERTLLEAVARGLSTKAISGELWISEKTVKFHLTNIYRKLGVHNRTGAVRYAFQHGLIVSSQDQALTA